MQAFIEELGAHLEVVHQANELAHAAQPSIAPHKRLDYLKEMERLGKIEALLRQAAAGETSQNTLEFVREKAPELRKAVVVADLADMVLADDQEADAETRTLWHNLSEKAERLSRQLDLLAPPTLGDFRAALWFLAERGEWEDTDLIREVKKHPPYCTREIVSIIETVERELSARVSDPYYVLQKGSEAYQRNEAAWKEQFPAHWIAIYGGRVVKSHMDRTELVKDILALQQAHGPLRVYIVKVGEPSVLLRGSAPRAIAKARPVRR
ncbi:MAG: hypothetical protein U0822_10025 [Anaerolineae bacterium]